VVEHPFEKYGGQIGIFSSGIGVNILQIFETTTNVFVELLLMVQKSCEHQLIVGINHHYLPRVSKTSHPWLFKYPHYLPKRFQKTHPNQVVGPLATINLHRRKAYLRKPT